MVPVVFCGSLLALLRPTGCLNVKMPILASLATAGDCNTRRPRQILLPPLMAPHLMAPLPSLIRGQELLIKFLLLTGVVNNSNHGNKRKNIWSISHERLLMLYGNYLSHTIFPSLITSQMTDLTEVTLESVLSAAEALKAVRCFISDCSSTSVNLIHMTMSETC